MKTDLYALGVTRYQIFTGNVPFSGPDFRQQHLHDPVPNAAGVSPAIMRIVLKLLDKEPTRRPQDARAVLELLEVEERMLAYDQERLLKAAVGAEAHASRVAATAATKAAQVQRAKDDRQQAIADLQTIIENSMTQINQALPDIALDTTKAGEWTIASDVASVSMSVWLDSEIDIQPSKRPRLVLAGEVTFGPAVIEDGGKTRFPAVIDEGTRTPIPAANLACERTRGGLLVWYLLSYTRRKDEYFYQVGPTDGHTGWIARFSLTDSKSLLARVGSRSFIVNNSAQVVSRRPN